MTRLNAIRVALTLAALIAIPPAVSAQQKAQSPVKVFILAGQSNMEGQGVADLEGKDYNDGKGTLNTLMKDPAKRALFKHLKDDNGQWVVRNDVWVRYKLEDGQVKAGPLALGFTPYDGRHHFGPELQFGHVMGDHLANQVLLIKTAWGGKSLYRDFRPPSSGGQVGPYYTRMIADVREALANLKKEFPGYDGGGYELAGFVWYHGWNDGCDPKNAVPEYESNLVNLIKDVRKELNAPTLPVIIGEMTGPWVEAPGEWAALRKAQAAAAHRPEFKGNVLFVETHDFVRKPEESPCPGHGHHEFANAETYFLVGNALGQGMKQLLSATATRTASKTPNLIPWPNTVTQRSGALTLGKDSRIVASDPRLRALAEIVAEEIQCVGGPRLPVADATGAAGDIILRLDTNLKGEAYALDVGPSVEIRGGGYNSVALGTVTLLQLLAVTSGEASIPCLSVTDAPATEYRGLMLDVARCYHSINNLKQMVQLCRFYKIRYLQLHLTDDQSFMFPSRTYPQLASQNQHGGKTYTIEELKDLLAYADARGVTIVPEYEVPGHSAAANRAMPDLFLIKGTKPYEHHASINFVKDEVMRAVATIVGEMCEVFTSSPYFHIGGDEADLALADQNADFKAAFKKHNLPDQHQLYRKLVCDLNEIVKSHGKRMIVWEGFAREPNSPVQIPKDIIVMAYEIRFYMPDQLVKDGYQVINASWTPLYVVRTGRPPEEIYAWNLRQFKPFGAKPSDPGVIVPPTGKVFGAQMCAWEQPENVELTNERLRLPAMSERIWNPAADRSYPDFEKRLTANDRLLDRLVNRLHVRAEEAK